MIRKIVVLALLSLSLASCGSDFEKSPLDNLIRDMSNVPAYSIILHDMNVEGTVFEDYYHQYEIIEINKNGAPEKRITEWIEVPEELFSKHIDDMGMELVSKSEDGKLSKTAAPPGYNNFVGNEQYGQWVDRGGTSFWEFYGQYMFLNSMFNLATFPIQRSYYDTYRTDYWGRKPYYGSMGSGPRMYGTGSSYARKVYGGSNWNRQSSSFRDKVRNSVSRSSGNRYNSSSSMRSRGGGFGK